MLAVSSSISPSALNAAFCVDPAAMERCGFDDGDTLGAWGPLFSTSAAHVSAVLGDATPEDARHAAFYVRLFAQAQVKYLRAATLFPTDLSKPEYAAFEPSATDLVVETSRGDGLVVDVIRYKDAYRATLAEDSGMLLDVRFRRLPTPSKTRSTRAKGL